MIPQGQIKLLERLIQIETNAAKNHDSLVWRLDAIMDDLAKIKEKLGMNVPSDSQSQDEKNPDR